MTSTPSCFQVLVTTSATSSLSQVPQCPTTQPPTTATAVMSGKKKKRAAAAGAILDEPVELLQPLGIYPSKVTNSKWH